MLALDRGALICDIAETYHVIDITSLPVPMLATLAVGLRDDSRICMKMSGGSITKQEMLAAATLDRLTTLCLTQSKDGAHGRNRPKSVLSAMAGEGNNEHSLIVRPVAYDSPEDFDRAWSEVSIKKAR